MISRTITLTIQTTIEEETEEEYTAQFNSFISDLEEKYDCVDVQDENDNE
jgi:hypothetical protein